MFEFKRLFKPASQTPKPGQRVGLTGGDISLLELLDFNLLSTEGQACDLSAGRVNPKDPADLRLRQSRVWREAARRSGDVVTLRRAASAAEKASRLVDEGSPQAWAEVRLEQGLCAMLGAEMFGDDGLNAAASAAFADAAAVPGAAGAAGAAGAVARAKRGIIAAHQALARNDGLQALAELTAHDQSFTALRPLVRDRDVRLALADIRLDRASATLSCATVLKDDRLAARALADIAAAVEGFDAAYEPLTVGRAWALRARGLVTLGDLTGEAARIAEAVEIYSRLFDAVARDHSPLDWARAQYGQGLALQALAETAGTTDALREAERAFDRAVHVLGPQPALLLRAEAANARAVCRVRAAELSDDPVALDEAEAVFRIELARCDPHRDPIGWALAQFSLARVYQTRAAVYGKDRGERVKAAMALDAALDVFAENGRHDLAVLAENALKGLATA
jgi:tetratricopeptide (TPR) repeat protein